MRAPVCVRAASPGRLRVMRRRVRDGRPGTARTAGSADSLMPVTVSGLVRETVRSPATVRVRLATSGRSPGTERVPGRRLLCRRLPRPEPRCRQPRCRQPRCRRPKHRSARCLSRECRERGQDVSRSPTVTATRRPTAAVRMRSSPATAPAPRPPRRDGSPGKQGVRELAGSRVGPSRAGANCRIPRPGPVARMRQPGREPGAERTPFPVAMTSAVGLSQTSQATTP